MWAFHQEIENTPSTILAAVEAGRSKILAKVEQQHGVAKEVDEQISAGIEAAIALAANKKVVGSAKLVLVQLYGHATPDFLQVKGHPGSGCTVAVSNADEAVLAQPVEVVESIAEVAPKKKKG